jgi:hypothetical protein
MEMRTFRQLVLAGLTTVILGGLGVASAEEIYTAKMVRRMGLRNEMVHLDLTVREYATEEDGNALQKIYDEQGEQAILAALRKGDRGEARVTGGLPRRVT